MDRPPQLIGGAGNNAPKEAHRMRFARRIAASVGLTVMMGAGLASPMAAGEPLGVVGPADADEGCTILALPLTLPCEPALPVEIEVTPEPVVSVGTVELAPPAEVTQVLPPVEPLEPREPVVAEVIGLVPATELGVGPGSTGAGEAIAVPPWSQARAPAGGAPAAQGAEVTPSAGAEPTQARPELEPASPSAASPASPPRLDSPAAHYAAFTSSKARAIATTPGANVAAAAGLAAVPVPHALIALTPALTSAAAVAIELARTGGGWASSIVFNVWLRRQLRERRMSQRQLAAFSGVDHSTISRLLSGARAPSLATATRLAEALRKLGGPDHPADYFARLSESQLFPTKRVEAALLGDDELEDDDVRELMNAYLVLRARRRRQRTAASENGEAHA